MTNSVETNGTTAVSTIAPELQIVDGQVTTTSTQVAQHFNKRHDTVLRAIRNLLQELDADHARNFAEMVIDVEIGSGATRKDPAYRMTRDGFMLLAMGFTGKEALQWKLAYIDTFNKMEAALTTCAQDHISLAQQQHLRELVQIIVESGKQTHGETWNRLHRKMKVTSYKLLPPDRFDDAVAYLHSKMDGESMAALVQKHFPDAVKALPAPAPEPKQESMEFSYLSLKNQRFLHTFDHTGREMIHRLKHDQMLVSWDDIALLLKDNFLMPTVDQLIAIVNAGVSAIGKRMQSKLIAA